MLLQIFCFYSLKLDLFRFSPIDGAIVLNSIVQI